MKLGVSSNSFSSYQRTTGCDYVALCKKAKEMGFDGIELVDLSTEIGQRDTVEDVAKDIREASERLSLPVLAYTIGASLLRPTPEENESEMERLCGQIEIAKTLGAPVMRHDAALALRETPGYTWERGVEEMAPYIRTVTAYAETVGVRTCVENHGYIYQDPERVQALIRAVNHRNFGWLLDIGNFSVVDRTATEALAYTAHHVFHVHAKDMILKSGDVIAPSGFHRSRGGNFWRGTVLGHGDVPVAKTLLALKAQGYTDGVSLEFGGPEDCLSSLSAGLTYMHRVLD